MADKYLDYSGVELLWRKIKQLVSKKLEKIKNADSSIIISGNDSVAVKISQSEDNLLSTKEDGLYSERPVLHKLTFGAGEAYVYDGTKDINVPVYNGEYDINN